MHRGDLIVQLQPVFPKKLNPRQRKLLLQANASLMEGRGRVLP
jgi:molecular chaperone DnaJ